MPELFQDSKGDFYLREDVVWKDVDTPGAQFTGWVTRASVEKSNCIERWKQVSPVKGRLHRSKPPKRPVAVLEVLFRGKWVPILTLTDPPDDHVWEHTMSEAIRHIRLLRLRT